MQSSPFQAATCHPLDVPEFLPVDVAQQPMDVNQQTMDVTQQQIDVLLQKIFSCHFFICQKSPTKT